MFDFKIHAKKAYGVYIKQLFSVGKVEPEKLRTAQLLLHDFEVSGALLPKGGVLIFFLVAVVLDYSAFCRT